MTAKANSSENSATVTVTVDGKDVVVPLSEVTDLVVALLAARKDGYSQLRTAKAATRAAAKTARDEKKAARTKAASVKKAARVEKLKADLAKLTA